MVRLLVVGKFVWLRYRMIQRWGNVFEMGNERVKLRYLWIAQLENALDFNIGWS